MRSDYIPIANELCGGNWDIDVYHAGTSSGSTTTATTTSAAAATSTASSSSSYTYVGCYTDGDSRVLSTNLISGSSSLTTETCMATCASAGYSYGGTEYGDGQYKPLLLPPNEHRSYTLILKSAGAAKVSHPLQAAAQVAL